MQNWIKFDAEQRRFSLRPTDLTPLGLTRTKVILDDSKSQIGYTFNFWVNEKPIDDTDPICLESESKPDPKPEPDPKSELNPEFKPKTEPNPKLDHVEPK